MSDTCSLFPPFGDPGLPACYPPSTDAGHRLAWICPHSVLILVLTRVWASSSLGPKWARRSGPIEGESSIVWTTVRSYLRPHQGPVMNSVNVQRGPESGHTEGQSEAQCGPDTGSSEESTQGPVRSRVLCSEAKHTAPWHSSSLDADSWPQGAWSLLLTGQWFWSTCWLWTSLGLDSVLTVAWFSSSLVLDSHPYFGWQFPSSGLFSADRMLGNLCSFVEWMAINTVVFRHVISSIVKILRWKVITFLQRLWSPESQSGYFLALCEPCEHIPESYWDHPWGNRLQECVWQSWVPNCFYLV